ncbi:MAG: hypothetical protein DHS20C21_12260 [Gemmatimonadota bacterium]|nr:MAG: hypothetical protein DHS20C21_12260 [Gemmatimonadota bacterium]
MTRLMRGLVVGLSLSMLFASVSLAGPTIADGDPDQPQRNNPGYSRMNANSAQVSLQKSNGKMAVQTQESSEDWRVLVKVYLKLLRIFAL